VLVSISSYNKSRLDIIKKVNEHIKKGYKPLGGILVLYAPMIGGHIIKPCTRKNEMEFESEWENCFTKRSFNSVKKIFGKLSYSYIKKQHPDIVKMSKKELEFELQQTKKCVKNYTQYGCHSKNKEERNCIGCYFAKNKACFVALEYEKTVKDYSALDAVYYYKMIIEKIQKNSLKI